MQSLTSQQLTKLKKTLKKQIKGNVADIFLIGSAMKNKISPRDVDIIVLFKEKKLQQIEEELYNINENIDVPNSHLEPIFVNSMFSENIFKTILHEGFSIRQNKSISNLMNLKSMSLFSYNLGNLTKTDKVRFAQTLYGRKKDGLLYSEKGKFLGQGSFMVPVQNEELFIELLEKWKVKFVRKRIFVSD